MLGVSNMHKHPWLQCHLLSKFLCALQNCDIPRIAFDVSENFTIEVGFTMVFS